MTGTANSTPKTLASNIEKGDTTVTFSADPGFVSGDYIFVKELVRDTVKIPIASTNIMQVMRLSASSANSGTTRTLEEGSFTQLKTANQATAYKLTMLKNAGLENLKIDWNPALIEGNGAGHIVAGAVSILFATNSWVSNIEASNGGTGLVGIDITTHITIQGSYFHNIQYTDEGHIDLSQAIHIGFGSAENLMWNNRFSNVEASVKFENHPVRNVWAYNYSWNLMNGLKDSWTHGAYPEENLFEGNSGTNVKGFSDDWWGGAFASTYFRNRYLGTNERSGMSHESQGRGGWAYSYENQLLNVYRNLRTIPGCTEPNCFNFDGGWNGVAGDNLWAEKNRFTNLFVQSGRNGAVLPSTTYVDDSAACLTNTSYCKGFVGPTIRTSAGVLSTGYDGTTVPTSWAGASFPSSFFLTARPPWWCDETPWPGIGADIDNTNNLSKTPAQRVAEGLSCSLTRGNLPPPPPTNQTPTASAGSDQTITLPNTASLNGTVTDDNLPNPPAQVSPSWSRVSGPGIVTFLNANSIDTTATFSVAGTFVLRLSATDSALSSADDVSVTVNPAGTSSCTTSSTVWQNTAFTPQSTPFTAEFDVTPTAAGLDAITALSTSATTAYTSFPILIRFGGLSLQYIEARNGTVYGATNPMTYTIGTTYHFRLVVKPTSNPTPVAKSYSIYVRPAGGTEQLLASNFAFRDGQTNTSSFANLGIISDPIGHRVCNFTVTSTPPANTISSLSLFTPTLDINLPGLGRSFSVSFFTPGATTALSTSIVTGTSGSITFTPTNLSPGTYDVRVKRDGSLYRKKSNLSLSNNTNLGTFSPLISGDINNDNAINALDWSMMSPDWFQTGRPSDINGDGITNALDFTWLNRNWFLTGE
jgi:hypothetical protein